MFTVDRIEATINKVNVCRSDASRNGGLDTKVLLLPLFARLYI